MFFVLQLAYQAKRTKSRISIAFMIPTERYGDSTISTTTSTTDTMHVFFDVVRQIVIDHMANVGNVQSSRSYLEDTKS
ncbi:hypothetical protein T05_8000 [Trichinella murrelli]|uniref:Uncharacterized protein n=1 Tax=Trichinella murrelli TaxID=144512 RepID=A0A0V0U4D6_9BILA|nr:hypothetical protein T05_8000 [Trichinella murrelli]